MDSGTPIRAAPAVLEYPLSERRCACAICACFSSALAMDLTARSWVVVRPKPAAISVSLIPWFLRRSSMVFRNVVLRSL